jgi:hypothetical protein
MNESEFQAALERVLNSPGSGMRVWRQNAGHITISDYRGKRALRFAPPGAADLVGIVDGGRHLEIECKAKGGRLTDRQRAWGDMIQRRGGVWVCVWAPDVDAAVRLIRAAIEGYGPVDNGGMVP